MSFLNCSACFVALYRLASCTRHDAGVLVGSVLLAVNGALLGNDLSLSEVHSVLGNATWPVTIRLKTQDKAGLSERHTRLKTLVLKKAPPLGGFAHYECVSE